mmetsp:Transcript_24132/g.34570  ORF Transcript_24132/g.34570 Transcript_24132/m.34570 type:complete len:94 (+) Transcript_24132:330-611(+)
MMEYLVHPVLLQHPALLPQHHQQSHFQLSEFGYLPPLHQQRSLLPLRNTPFMISASIAGNDSCKIPSLTLGVFSSSSTYNTLFGRLFSDQEPT